MNTLSEALEYLKNEESNPNKSYAKIGENSNNLIVSFTSAFKNHFERKNSLLEPRYEHNYDYDVLYIKDQFGWYLGGIKGIGKNITHTQAFLRKEFSKYENVVCTGYSMGGYASILFGSLCKAPIIVAIEPQTDLEIVLEDGGGLAVNQFITRRKQCMKTYERYHDLSNHLNNESIYYVFFESDLNIKLRQKNITALRRDIAFHGGKHYEKIKNHKNVLLVQTREELKDLIISKALGR